LRGRVPVVRVGPGAAAAATARREVEFFFSLDCPWSHLAFLRLVEAAMRTDALVVYRPVATRMLSPDSGQIDRRLAPQPAIAAWARQDLQDWARFCGVRLALPEPAPSPSPSPEADWAPRGAVAAIELGRGREYLAAIGRARFQQARDLADRAVVVDLAAASGLDRAAFATRLEQPATLEILQCNAAELRRRGGFGSPTMCIGRELYFGHDRLPLVESALLRAGEQPFIAPGEHDRI
jgi:2-hydroxychromene-2-carboxylate isomerase